MIPLLVFAAALMLAVLISDLAYRSILSTAVLFLIDLIGRGELLDRFHLGSGRDSFRQTCQARSEHCRLTVEERMCSQRTSSRSRNDGEEISRGGLTEAAGLSVDRADSTFVESLHASRDEFRARDSGQTRVITGAPPAVLLRAGRCNGAQAKACAGACAGGAGADDLGSIVGMVPADPGVGA